MAFIYDMVLVVLIMFLCILGLVAVGGVIAVHVAVIFTEGIREGLCQCEECSEPRGPTVYLINQLTLTKKFSGV